MAARAISSGTISFGLVSIPVKLYTAASSEQVSFNMLHAKCGGRIKQQLFCPKDNEVIGRNDTVRGFEYARGQFATFTEAELKTLESERSNSIEIVEFVPLASVDFLQVERSYYLGADKGGDKAYRLLSHAMQVTDRVAVGRWAARGKEQLVLIRPYAKAGLVFHQLYYQNELRSFDEIDPGATFTFSEKEQELARKLVEQLSVDKFDATPYRDSYSDRVRTAVDQKIAGQEVVAAAEGPKAQIIDLFEALKRSLNGPGAAPKSHQKPEPAPLKKTEPRKRTALKKAESGSG